MNKNLEEALRIFSIAYQYIEDAGLVNEVAWHRDIEAKNFSESDLLRESAWVILCGGFRESIVNRIFDYISLCFCDWESAEAILSNRQECLMSASQAFKNERKLNAIIDIAAHVEFIGFEVLKEQISKSPIKTLQEFSYIGPITSFHLAKNLGFDMAKPDRHLMWLSAYTGYGSVFELCGEVAKVVGESERVVDLVLWRYMADNLSFKREVFADNEYVV